MDYYTTSTYSLEVNCSAQPHLTEAVHSLMGSYLWRPLVEVNNSVGCPLSSAGQQGQIPFAFYPYLSQLLPGVKLKPLTTWDLLVLLCTALIRLPLCAQTSTVPPVLLPACQQILIILCDCPSQSSPLASLPKRKPFFRGCWFSCSKWRQFSLLRPLISYLRTLK